MIRFFVMTLFGLMSIGVHAQYPTKPVHLIVPYAAGAIADTTARIVARDLAAELGQPVVVENRPGGEGLIGATSVTRAAPDGYTLLLATGSVIGPALAMRKVPPYDPSTDLTPIGLLGPSPFILLVHPSVPAKDLNELVAYARANPNKLNYGTGNATAIVGSAQLMKATGIAMVHIPYKGEATSLPDLLSGRIQVQLYASVAQAMPLAKEGRLRILAVSLDERSPLLPDVPTFEEVGVSGIDSRAWFGLFGPANLPRDVIARLSLALNASLAKREFRDELTSQGVVPVRETSPQKLRDYATSQYAMWKQLVKEVALPLE